MMKKKIMVVDDEPDQIITIRVALEDLSDKFEIIGVGSGMQCLELLKNNQIPDLILLDVMMPGMSGWEIFNRLKENQLWKNIPVIFLTALTDEVAKNIGGFLDKDYIEKPYDIEDLKIRIERILGKTH
jgi:CheY-like chemotaxis protein